MKKMIFIAGILAVAIGWPHPARADSLRCNDGLIQTGQSTLEVVEKIGEPEKRKKGKKQKEVYHRAAGGHVLVEQLIEYWYYHCNMWYKLTFEDDVLVKIESTGKH